MNATEHALNWFEIPVADLERAKKFYEAIFDMEMGTMEMPDQKMYTFPYEPGSSTVSGALVEDANAISKMDGVTLYLNANPNIDKVIDRIEGAGGKILIAKTQISPEIGYMCFFNDSEGNRMALHANA